EKRLVGSPFNESIAKLTCWVAIHNCAANTRISGVLENDQTLLGRQVVIHERKTPRTLANNSLRLFTKKCRDQGKYGGFACPVYTPDMCPFSAVYSDGAAFNLVEGMMKNDALQSVALLCRGHP